MRQCPEYSVPAKELPLELGKAVTVAKSTWKIVLSKFMTSSQQLSKLNDYNLPEDEDQVFRPKALPLQRGFPPSTLLPAQLLSLPPKYLARHLVHSSWRQMPLRVSEGLS